MADRREAARSSTGAAEAGIRGDRLGARLGAPSAQAPVSHDQNYSAPIDLGHLLHGGIGDTLRVGIRNLDTASPWDLQNIM
jgi:hypothetical protein